MNLENLFNPASIAIVGASEEEGKVGNVLAKNVLTLGYSGKVFLVNPKHDTLFGQKCYHNLAEIEESVDLAVISIPAKFVLAEIEQNAEKIKNYVIISAGFSEMSAEGKEREEGIKKIAEEKNLSILGPNCLGFIVPKLKLNATFASGMPESGNIALISQSGALMVGMMDIAEEKNFKFSHIVSIGNKMQVTETEIIKYLEKDPAVKVIGLYLEGIKNGQEFAKVASAVSKTKPIVLMKAGKTAKAQKAISSHTGALAGSDDIISAVCEKTGIIRASNLEEFFNILDLITLTAAPKSELCAIVTNAGGPGVLTTDAFSGHEIKLADISDKTKEKLRMILPEESSVENPIDVLGDAHEDRYKKVLATLGKDASIGSIISILTPQDQTPVGKVASKIIQFKNKSQANNVALFIGGKSVKKAEKKLRENGIPNFNYPHEAVDALDKYYRWNIKKEALKIQEGSGDNINPERKEKVIAIINHAKSSGRTALYFSEAKEIMSVYGINTVKCWEAQDGDLNVKFPVVLKVDSDKVLHKTDRQGLILNIQNEDELKSATERMKNNFPGEKLIIQPMVERKTELILGIQKDSVFGPVLMYGLGGIYTEVFKMVNFLVPPLDLMEIKDGLMKSKISFLFQKTRGQEPYDLDELANILWGLSNFAQEIEAVREFDINPLLIYNDNKEAVAVDVKIVI